MAVTGATLGIAARAHAPDAIPCRPGPAPSVRYGSTGSRIETTSPAPTLEDA
ncbi:hypothetical protein [Cellulomonas sp. S1-8]|uniref:hypothetical protein n=1 Tax=Cellulomonas sp. S1-8 TaxID=2904790 RepID=UPI00224378DB|nr:hypothetical protein [Cellulomonas sp. S1-8]UZN03081.1 hypothetical protein OKX07_18835 [Cellulomonas sp. S1-8]